MAKPAIRRFFFFFFFFFGVPTIGIGPSRLNLSLSQQENTQTLGAARFKPSARFIHEKTKRYKTYHRNVIYNPSNIQLQRTRSQAN